MKDEKLDIKKGVKLHLIKTEFFKTNLASVLITVPLKKDTVTVNSLIPFLLKRGTSNYKSQYEISEKLENLYGSIYNCGIDKSGDNQVIKFYMEGINDKFLPNDEDLLKEDLELLFEIIFNPLMEDGKFKSDFFDMEKRNLENIINGKIDDKDSYAFNDCLEKMYGCQGYGLYKYGYIEELEKITLDSVTNAYRDLIANSKIDIFVAGNFDCDVVKNIVFSNENIMKLNDRDAIYVQNNPIKDEKEKINQVNELFEKMNVSQGKLILGLDIFYNNDNYKYVALMYNAILGESANSKMFQNVREKAGLCYTARSTFIKQKKNIFIRCGIEIPNYEKAVELIKVQLEDMKSGKFTDEDIENAKNYLISGIKSIETEQDSIIVYYMGQEMAKTNEELPEYIEKINKIEKQDIIDFANTVELNTIYFLKS